MKDPSFILRAAAVVVFILATLGVSPVPMDAARVGVVGRVDLGAVSDGLERGGLRA